MKIKYILAVVLVATFAQFGIADDSNMKQGDKYYQLFDFYNAVKKYEQILKKEPSNLLAKEKIATCYRLMNNTVEMENWYGQVVADPQAGAINKFYYAQALRSNEKYDDALKYYNQYKQSSKDQRPLDIISGYKYIDNLKKPTDGVKLENLTTVNSPQSDFSPMFYRDTAILFVSNSKKKGSKFDNWTQENFLDIYKSSKKDNNTYGAPSPFFTKKINGDYHEGPISFTNDYGVLYLTRSNYTTGKPLLASDKKTNNLKIYRVNYEGNVDNWATIQEAVPFNSNEYSVAHPAFSADDNDLYFASNMPGGQGGTDLWVTHKVGNGWSTPENLGAEINTPGEEKFPFVAKDGTLYYSSDGLYGLGGLDIYKAKKNASGKYEKPENLGSPFNSSKDDFGYIASKDNMFGYLSSNRPGGLGDDDIYMWKSTSVKLIVKVIDAKTKKPIELADEKLVCDEKSQGTKKTDTLGLTSFILIPDSKCQLKSVKAGYKTKNTEVEIGRESKEVVVELEKENKPEMKLEFLVLDKKTNQPIPGATLDINGKNSGEKVRAKTNNEGKLILGGIVSNNEYAYKCNKETGDPNKQYLAVSGAVNTTGKVPPATLKEVIYLDLVEKNVAIRIDNIYYDLDKFFIRPDAARELDKLVKILTDNPTMEIELSSHTDCRSSYQYNMQLSAKRAEAAVNYIISKGIDSKRMIAAGYGESRLVNDCKCEMPVKSTCTEEQHQMNRRTEIKILKF